MVRHYGVGHLLRKTNGNHDDNLVFGGGPGDVFPVDSPLFRPLSDDAVPLIVGSN